MPLIKVIIVEDHPLFSKGLSSLIISQPPYMVVGEARNFSDAMELARNKKPHLAIVDLNLGNENGMDVISGLKQVDSKIKILVLSMHDERYHAEQVLQAGAHGYIMKEAAGDKVIDAIKVVMSGEIYLSAAEKERLSSGTGKTTGKTAGKTEVKTARENGDPFNLLRNLTDRQLQIFSLIGKGLGTAEIAAKLNLSSKTVDAHKENIKTKIHCDSSQLRQLAIEWNKR